MPYVKLSYNDYEKLLEILNNYNKEKGVIKRKIKTIENNILLKRRVSKEKLNELNTLKARYECMQGYDYSFNELAKMFNVDVSYISKIYHKVRVRKINKI